MFPGSSPYHCEWGSSSFDHEPKSSDVLSVRLTGVRGSDTLCVDVLARGFVRGRNTSPSEVDIARGEVFVDIWTAEPREPPGAAAGRPCAELPPFPE